MLDEAEAKWAPPGDPVFQLAPPDFEPYVAQCFEDLGNPEVTFDTFWDVYCELQDLVEVAIPGDIAMTLSESIRGDADGMLEPFELVHLKEPEFKGIEDDENEEEDDAPYVDFTNEEDEDQLF